MKLVSTSLIKGTIFYLAKKDNILTHPKKDVSNWKSWTKPIIKSMPKQCWMQLKLKETKFERERERESVYTELGHEQWLWQCIHVGARAWPTMKLCNRRLQLHSPHSLFHSLSLSSRSFFCNLTLFC